MTPETLAEYRAYAERCDGRQRRTRCRSCAKILTLIAHVELLERRSQDAIEENDAHG